ncbi:MAG: DNA cytosine methyltransferase [Bryobacteraceae bacterium]
MLFENVRGLLSDDEGRSFASWLKAMADCGDGCAYRVRTVNLPAWHSGASVDTYCDIRWWFAYRLFSR